MSELDSRVSKNRNSLSLLRSGVLVSVCTFLSRILGLVRDAALAFVLGASGSADAFYVAFKIPNFFRRLFAEGAFAQAFVPVLSEYRVKEAHEDVRALVAAVTGSLALVLLCVTALFMVCAPWVVYVFAPGFVDDASQAQLASELLVITFPYLLFISLTALAGGILNAHGEYAVPAITPIFLNISLIVATLVFARSAAQAEVAVAWGVFFAGLIQLLFQVPFLARLKLLPMPKMGFGHPGVKRILILIGPALFGVSVGQINLLLDTVLASFLETGSITWLYLSDRLYELPLGIFAIAISTVILPSLSRSFSGGEASRFSETMDWALRLLLLIAIPSSLALFMLAEPLIATIFYRGELTSDDVFKAAQSLQAYSLGLVFMMLIKVLAPGYYARQDTKTPVKIGIVAMVSNMVFNLILVWPLGHVGLALATSLSAALNAFLLWCGLYKAKHHVFTVQWRVLLRILICATLALAACLYVFQSLGWQWTQMSDIQRIAKTLLMVCSGVAVYGVVAVVAGLRPSIMKH
ncbi:murein biosynthesis integral membrane protein MurJ [Marinomonas posidonica]|uniref:Probable lipid II flippase MurJ n=1 Tax=Marinomonas posidonica (strain CECT 7376 / NCIMB 14433 / IVIA-Po-181) TaxID=491952 RepID=F6CTU9_MARPP|nr:murein biosynthesis integral membrane protein MurJ [Marinomonas posidonica]AEF56318.1 integral membrane protein MviN [Marinomonas posidonica IVIA-Po-181]